MKMVSAAITVLLALVASSEAFTSSLPSRSTAVAPQSPVLVWSTTEEAPTSTADAPSDLADVEIPRNLPSDCGKDYVPLATMLATGQFEEADQVCDLCGKHRYPSAVNRSRRSSRPSSSFSDEFSFISLPVTP